MPHSEADGSKFMPQIPQRKVSGRKITLTTVSRFITLLVWYATIDM